MLDFSLSELLLCFVVALVVLGPERMPAIARTVGRWTGKTRNYMRNIAAELERETQVAEVRNQIDDARRILCDTSKNLHHEMRKLVEEANPVTTAIGKPPGANG